jgi:hypothetical protein
MREAIVRSDLTKMKAILHRARVQAEYRLAESDEQGRKS